MYIQDNSRYYYLNHSKTLYYDRLLETLFEKCSVTDKEVVIYKKLALIKYGDDLTKGGKLYLETPLTDSERSLLIFSLCYLWGISLISACFGIAILILGVGNNNLDAKTSALALFLLTPVVPSCIVIKTCNS